MKKYSHNCSSDWTDPEHFSVSAPVLDNHSSHGGLGLDLLSWSIPDHDSSSSQVFLGH